MFRPCVFVSCINRQSCAGGGKSLIKLHKSAKKILFNIPKIFDFALSACRMRHFPLLYKGRKVQKAHASLPYHIPARACGWKAMAAAAL